MDLNCRDIFITTLQRLCDVCSSFRTIRKSFFANRPTAMSKKARATLRMNSILGWESREFLFPLIKEEPASPGELFAGRCDWVSSCPLDTLPLCPDAARESKPLSVRQTSHKFPGDFRIPTSLSTPFLQSPKTNRL